MRTPVFENLSDWVRNQWKLVLLVLGLAGVFIASGLWTSRNHKLPPVVEEGVVVRFGAYSFDKGPQPVVLVRMADGQIVQLNVRRGSTHNCRRGSRIRLIRQGDSLRVAPRGCAPLAA